MCNLSCSIYTVSNPGGGWTTQAVLAGRYRGGAVVEQNTAAALSWEVRKLCTVGPGKTSSLTLHCPDYVGVKEEDLVQAQVAVLLLEYGAVLTLQCGRE